MEPGAKVAVWADRTPDTIATALAAMAIGAAYVPLDPAYPIDRIAAILRVLDPDTLVHGGQDGTARPPVRARAWLDLAEVKTDVPRLPGTRPGPSDVAYVIFTSGSTGDPKGVVVNHRSLLNYSLWCASVLGRAGRGTPLVASLGFDHAITCIWPPLIAGNHIVMAGGIWDHKALFQQNEPFTFIKATPSHVRFLERTHPSDYRRLTKLMMFGGEPLDVGLIRNLGKRLSGIRLMNHYGPTETTVGCCFHEFRADNALSLPTVPIGRPIWNTRAYLVDDNLAPVDRGEAELVIAGDAVACGYLARAPGSDFIDECEVGGDRGGRAYRTGDWVELVADRVLLYIGRRDDEVKVSGHRVKLNELRRHALLISGVADAAFALDPTNPDLVEAFVVPSTQPYARSHIEAQVRNDLANSFPRAVVPRNVHFVSEIVINAHGKTDVGATRAASQGRS